MMITLRPIPRVGDYVRPDDHPEGFPLWRVAAIAPGAGPSDVVDLVPTDQAAPLTRMRRTARSLSVVLPP